MLLDSRLLSDGSLLTADVIVIGGGFAGLTIALELGKKGYDVIVLESGGDEPDPATQDLYRGGSSGQAYRFADGSRSRYLGGSSNCWDGWCRPFDAMDFTARPWVQDSGWPINLADLEPYYQRTHQHLELGPYVYDSQRFVDAINRADVRRIPQATGKVEDSLSQFSPPTRMAAKNATELKDSDRIRIYQFANTVNIESKPGASHTSFVHCQTLSGTTFTAKGRFYVLATGGIENARLLLASNRSRPDGLGNEHDLVGRYFMDHPRVRSGVVKFHPGWKSNLLYDAKFNLHNPKVSGWGTEVAAAMRLTRETQREEGITDALVWFMSEFHGENTAAYDALVRLRHRKIHREKLAIRTRDDLSTVLRHPVDSGLYALARKVRSHALTKTVRLQAIAEPEPNRNSRVSLSRTEKDALGMARVDVSWQLTDNLRRTFDRNFEIIAAELRLAGVADVVLDQPLTGMTGWPDSFEDRGTWHHMGTTRMHDDPHHGVVDANCKVHSVDNLFVAGSSVFTTGGANYPTQTLIALALRLSEHIGEKLKTDSLQTRMPEQTGAEPVAAAITASGD